MRKEELKFVLDVLAEKDVTESIDLDWYAILGFLELNKISGYFFNKTSELGVKPPHTLLKYSMERLNTFYKNGERISNDIDVLIEQKDITKLTNILKNMGFVQGYYNFKEDKVIELSRQEILARRMNRGETAPSILKIDNEILPFIDVDINFSMDYLPNGNESMMDKILADTVDYAETIKGGIKSLSGGDFFIHLIMHQYKESILYSMVERNKDFELYKLLDIYLFIKRGYIDLLGLHNSIKKYKLEKEMYYVLKTVSEVFDDLEISGFLEMIKPEIISYLNEVIDPPAKKLMYGKCMAKFSQ